MWALKGSRRPADCCRQKPFKKNYGFPDCAMFFLKKLGKIELLCFSRHIFLDKVIYLLWIKAA
jgi:hypothetical protein